MISRRETLKLTGAAALGLVATRGNRLSAQSSSPAITVAGYPYDRVQAIKDELVGIDGAEVSFQNENIYSLNTKAFGPDRPYEISEMGLIPFVSRTIYLIGLVGICGPAFCPLVWIRE